MKIMQRSSEGLPIPLTKSRVALVLATVFAMLVATSSFSQGQTFSLLYQFRSGDHGVAPYAGPVLDAKGNLYGTTYQDGAHAGGTVYKLSPTGKQTLLYSFTGIKGDGEDPYIGNLARDAEGNLYGTTGFGGIYDQSCSLGCGIVYRVDENGEETVLHRFNGNGVDGFSPGSGVVRDSSGNLYGTTGGGGTFGIGTVFEVNASGKETILYSFSGGIDGGGPLAGLIMDSKGNLYGTAPFGGSGFAGVVFQVDPSGSETVLYSFTGGADGGSPSAGLLLDSAGNLYGTTFGGGANGLGTVFKVTPSGGETVLYSFTGGADGLNPDNASLIRDVAGNLYGTTAGGGAHSVGTVFKVDPQGVETVLHTFNHADGHLPSGTLAIDSKGNLYGTTVYGGAYGGGVVFKIAP
jgi:uncharacterized repeat protein (TIGR03803 family)